MLPHDESSLTGTGAASRARDESLLPPCADPLGSAPMEPPAVGSSIRAHP